MKNQHVFTQALASYLPSSTDPQYPEYEKQFPGYRRGLEERYPQVCDKCRPRVEERLRVTGYAAKTDYLRRMMDQSRATQRSRYRWDWRTIVAHTGGLGWLLGLIGQLWWNALGALADFEGELRDHSIPIPLQIGLQQTLGVDWTSSKYANRVEPLASVSLVLGVLSIWWNPKLSKKISGQTGRLVGLREFYRLQGILHLTRLLAWYSVGGDHGFHLDSSATKAVHAMMLIFNFVVSCISYLTVKIDSTPRVIFQDSPHSFRPHQPMENQTPSGTIMGTPALSARSSINHHDASAMRQFPIDRLASTPSTTYTSSYQAPMLPPEDDVDAMDWSPSKAAFEPARPVRISKPAVLAIEPEPSPFYGQLPSAPMSKARYLRNPPNQPASPKTSSVQQQRFLCTTMSSGSVENYDSDEAETEDYADMDAKRSTPMANRINIDKPSFFAQSDLEADTGLESLINGLFSLADDPPEIRAEREKQIYEQQLLEEERNLRIAIAQHDQASWERIANIVLLSLACVSWFYAGSETVIAQMLRFSALGIAAVIIGRALFDAINIHQTLWKASDILVLGVELGITVFLGRTVKSSGTGEYGRGPIVFLGALWVQEFISFIRKPRAAISNAMTSTVQSPPATFNDRELAVSSLPSQNQSLVLASQDSVVATSPSRTRSQAASIVPQPRWTEAQRVEPSDNLPGLSLGPRKKPSHASTAVGSSGWSSNPGIGARSMRSSNGTPVWGRGNL